NCQATLISSNLSVLSGIDRNGIATISQSCCLRERARFAKRTERERARSASEQRVKTIRRLFAFLWFSFSVHKSVNIAPRVMNFASIYSILYAELQKNTNL